MKGTANTSGNMTNIAYEADSMDYVAEALKMAIRQSSHNEKTAGQNLANLVYCDDKLVVAFNTVYDIITSGKYSLTKSIICVDSAVKAVDNGAQIPVVTPVAAPVKPSVPKAGTSKIKTTKVSSGSSNNGTKDLKSLGASPVDIGNIYATLNRTGILLPEQKGRGKRIDCVQAVYKVYTTLGATKFDRMFGVIKRGNLTSSKHALQGNVVRAISEIYAAGPVDDDIFIAAINEVDIDSLAISTNNGTRDKKSIGDYRTVASILNEKYKELCEADKAKNKGKRMSAIAFSADRVITA